MRSALAFIGLLALASCGGDSKKSTTDTANDTAADTTADTSPDTTPDTSGDTSPEDSTPDTVPDTSEDTVEDTAPDTVADTAEDTTQDTGPDTTAACPEGDECFEVGAGETVKLATLLDNTTINAQTGLAALDPSFGIDDRRGVEVARILRPSVLGHDVELVGDDLLDGLPNYRENCNNLDPDLATNADLMNDIIDRGDVAAVLGPICSNDGAEIAPIATAARHLVVSPNNQSPSLTDPANRPPDSFYYRTAPNGKYAGAAAASFAKGRGMLTAATISDGSIFSDGVASSFRDAFGGDVPLLSPTATAEQIASTVDALVGEPPDIIYITNTSTAVAQAIVIAIESESALADTRISMTNATAVASLWGAPLGSGADGVWVSSLSTRFASEPTYQDAFLPAYQQLSEGAAPPNNFHGYAFDAYNITLDAIEAVAIETASGGHLVPRQALRDALEATNDTPGLTTGGDTGLNGLTCDGSTGYDVGDCTDNAAAFVIKELDCGGDAPDTACTLIDPPVAPEPIVLAGPISLSGLYAGEGGQVASGVKAAIRWINEVHGGVSVGGQLRPLEYRYLDDHSSAVDVGTILQQYCDSGEADFFLSPYSTGLTLAALPVAEACGKILLVEAGASDAIFAGSPDFAVQLVTPGSAWHRGFLDLILAQGVTAGDLDVAFAYETDPFAASVRGPAITYAEALGFNVVFQDSYPKDAGEVELGTYVGDLAATSPDIILGGGHAFDTIALARVLDANGVAPMAMSLLVGPAAPSYYQGVEACPAPCDYAAHPAEGVSSPANWAVGATFNQQDTEAAGLTWFGPSQQEFLDLFHAEAGANVAPGQSAAGGAVAVIVLMAAIEQANGVDTQAVRAALGDLECVTFYGDYGIDETGLQIGHDTMQVQWQDGALQIVWPTAAKTADFVYPIPCRAVEAVQPAQPEVFA